jgi:hypothetical protein
VLAAVVLAGYVPGPIHLGNPSAGTSSTARQTGGNSSSPKVEGSANQAPTARPTTAASATPQQPEGSRLCHDIYSFLYKNPGTPVGWKQEMSHLRQLIKFAGGLRRVPGYCAPYVRDLFPHGTLPRIPGSGDQGTESSHVGQDSQGMLAHL